MCGLDPQIHMLPYKNQSLYPQLINPCSWHPKFPQFSETNRSWSANPWNCSSSKRAPGTPPRHDTVTCCGHRLYPTSNFLWLCSIVSCEITRGYFQSVQTDSGSESVCPIARIWANHHRRCNARYFV